MQTEIFKIAVIILVLILGGSLGFYSFLKTMAKKGEAAREVKVNRIQEVTLDYVKDWMEVEIGKNKNRAAAIMKVDRLEDSMDSLVPEELRQDTEHLLLLTASQKGTVYKMNLIYFESIEKKLSIMLEKSHGVIKVEK